MKQESRRWRDAKQPECLKVGGKTGQAQNPGFFSVITLAIDS